MAVLFSRCEKEMDCSKEVVIWNYFDHEHVVGTHYKYYDKFNIVAEKDDWTLVERSYKLPIIGYRTSSFGFMYLENPNLIRSLQFGKLGFTMDQLIHLTDIGPDRCLVATEYRLNVPFFLKPFEGLWRKITERWFLNTWDEDAPMRLRRQQVWKLGFRNFVGIDYINQKTAKPPELPSERPYPVELPVPKTKGRKDGEYERPFATSVEVGYPKPEQA
jgi:hypothetical protein